MQAALIAPIASEMEANKPPKAVLLASIWSFDMRNNRVVTGAVQGTIILNKAPEKIGFAVDARMGVLQYRLRKILRHAFGIAAFAIGQAGLIALR
jgi:hypothetical protein